MSDSDPYSTPEADLGGGEEDKDTQAVAAGQKIIIWAIVINFATIFLQNFVSPIFAFLAIVAWVVAIYGVFKLSKGLRYSTVSAVLLSLLMIIPLINIIVLLILSSRATKHLRSVGYKVGLMGAKPPEAPEA